MPSAFNVTLGSGVQAIWPCLMKPICLLPHPLKTTRLTFMKRTPHCWSVWFPQFSSSDETLTQGKPAGQRTKQVGVALEQRFWAGTNCPPGHIWQCLEICLVATTGRGVLLASRRRRPGMLLFCNAPDSTPSKAFSRPQCQ